MKTKILRYSTRKLNQVVTHYAELEKVCDNVYTYRCKKGEYREEDDLIAVVIQIENVYFQRGTYSRRFLKNKSLAETGSAFVTNFHKMIKEIMQNNQLLPILYVRVYEQLGHDITPLLQYRENRSRKIERQKQEQMREKEQADQLSAAREKERLQTEKDKFIAGETINAKDFVALCKQEEIKMTPATLGVLKQSVLEISAKNIRYLTKKGKRPPKLNGCLALVNALKQKLGITA